MTEAELVHIEAELDIELPSTYRKFIANYPAMLLRPGTDATKFELLNSPDNIIKLNQVVRSWSSFDWPDEYLVIGQSGCGDYYAIDVDDEYSPVYLWNHEIGDFAVEEQTDSLEEFAGSLVETYRTLSEAKARMSPRSPPIFQWLKGLFTPQTK